MIPSAHTTQAVFQCAVCLFVAMTFIQALDAAVMFMQEGKLVPPEVEAGDYFGNSVSISDSGLYVAGSTFFGNAVYVYEYDTLSGRWSNPRTLQPSGGHLTGLTVAINNQGLCVIGAPGNYKNAGVVHLFELAEGSWSQTDSLVSSDSEVQDGFGCSVALNNDDYVVIGAYLSVNQVGAVYTFAYNDSTSSWVQTARLLASGGSYEDWFGISVSISDVGLIVVGAAYEDSKGGNVGSAYVFEYQSDTKLWSQQAQLFGLGLAPPANFGRAVDITRGGGMIVVGAPYGNNWRGAAFVFEFNPVTQRWRHFAELTASDAPSSSQYGYAVSISDAGFLGIGSFYSSALAHLAGEAYVYESLFNATTTSAAVWSEVTKVFAADGAEADRFGFSIAINDGGYIAIGSRTADANGTDTGAVYTAALNCSSGHCECTNGTWVSYLTSNDSMEAPRCVNCTVGRYRSSSITTDGETQEDDAALACIPCAIGTFSAAEGAVSSAECIDCAEGTFQPLMGQPSCLNCSGGTYQPLPGQSICHDCPAGTYQPFVGQTFALACKNCSRGSFSTAGQANCTNCSAGTYQPGYGKATCISCASGKYQPYEGQVSALACRNCSRGSFSSTPAQASCMQCSSGMFQELEGQSECRSCGPGTYQELEGQLNCSNCSAGTYQALEGQQNCNNCSSGTYQELPGQVSCSSCLAGYHQPLEGQANASACKMCAPGTFSATSGEASCTTCGSGEYQPAEGQSSCLLCPPGTAQQSEARTHCENCSAGTYQPDDGQAKCLNCSAGSYQPLQGQDDCLQCDPGTYSARSGQVSCIICPAGTAQPQGGQSSCQVCEAGKYQTAEGQLECDNCRPGTHQALEGQTSATACLNCTAGQFSDAAGQASCTNCTAGTYQPRDGGTLCRTCDAGKYQSREGQSDCIRCIGLVERENTLCTPCSAGTIFSGRQAGCVTCPLPAFCPDGTSCAPGRTGTGCTECQRGYFELNGSCQRCPQHSEMMYAAACVLVAVCLALLFRMSKAVDPAVTTSLTMAIIHVQTAALLVTSTRLRTPALLRSVMSWIAALVGFEFLDMVSSPECTVPLTFATRWALTVALPLGLLIVWAIVVRALCSGRPEYMRFPFLVADVLYLSLSQRSLEMFNCRESLSGSGDAVLATNPAEECYATNEEWLCIAVLSGAVVLMYSIGAPLTKLRFLRNLDREDENMQKALGFLFLGFKPQAWFWSLPLAAERLALTVTIVFASSQTGETVGIATVLTIFFAAHLRTMPLARGGLLPLREKGTGPPSAVFNNRLRTVQYGAQLAQLLLTALYSASNGEIMRQSLEIILVTVVLSGILIITGGVVSLGWAVRQEQIQISSLDTPETQLTHVDSQERGDGDSSRSASPDTMVLTALACTKPTAMI